MVGEEPGDPVVAVRPVGAHRQDVASGERGGDLRGVEDQALVDLAGEAPVGGDVHEDQLAGGGQRFRAGAVEGDPGDGAVGLRRGAGPGGAGDPGAGRRDGDGGDGGQDHGGGRGAGGGRDGGRSGGSAGVGAGPLGGASPGAV